MSYSNEDKQDPWSTRSETSNVESGNKFDDDFVKLSYQPLADSNQYLELLERKLRKVKNRTNKKDEFVKAFESTRDSYMLRIIQSNSREQLNLNQDTELEKTITPHSVNTWINPEQALTVGELAKLVQNDSLSTDYEKEEN